VHGSCEFLVLVKCVVHYRFWVTIIAGKSKVDEVKTPITLTSAEQEIFRFDITMDYMTRVDMLENVELIKDEN
jgi:hypothetical protein